MRFLKKVYHPLYFVLALFLGGLIGHKIKTWTDIGPQDPNHPWLFHSEPWMLVTSITIMVLVMLKDRYFEATAIRTLEDITAASKQSSDELIGWIKARLTPTIISVDTTNKVLEQASNIITAAIKEPSDGEKYVVFTGSAALYKDIEGDDAEANNPRAQYRTAMAELGNDTIRVERYICLLDAADYRKRPEPTREAYVKWLEKQISLVERNPKYLLYHCPRAPVWGGSRSSIFTARALLDIVGNGEGGVLIRGDRVAQDLKDKTKELFFEKAIIKPISYDKPALLNYMMTLNQSPQELLKEQHKGMPTL